LHKPHLAIRFNPDWTVVDSSQTHFLGFFVSLQVLVVEEGTPWWPETFPVSSTSQQQLISDVLEWIQCDSSSYGGVRSTEWLLNYCDVAVSAVTYEEIFWCFLAQYTILKTQWNCVIYIRHCYREVKMFKKTSAESKEKIIIPAGLGPNMYWYLYLNTAFCYIFECICIWKF